MRLLPFFLILFCFDLHAQQLKTENVGCPENSHCTKELGIKRDTFIAEIKKVSQESESKINQLIQKNSLYPITVWAIEDQKTNGLPLIFWNSPCKQHNPPNPKVLIAEIFMHDLSAQSVKKQDNVIFNKLFYWENKKWKFAYVPRGDAPLMIVNNQFYYIREEEGHYFGLMISKSGELNITKTKTVTEFPKELECKKEMIEEFYKEAPTLSFFKGQICKEIWNQDKKIYEPIMLGWSCN